VVGGVVAAGGKLGLRAEDGLGHLEGAGGVKME